ncbi:hypothetical protein CHS0354_031202 [Potamilus streckersoni]|uniref:Uncharacterized protein n=1 Tax=Potamilus streckersoni TaxID=2493646 RepID=A0AAE0TMZ8_9BIVA|nr:hypothetical protein CHS0354_031202 [Potamilus streckersoni]
MNFVVLFLVIQTLSASLSKAESIFDLFEQPWLQMDADSTISSKLLLGSESPGSPNQSRGYMENCDPNSNYNISWEPKEIDPHVSLRVFVNYTAPADVDGAEYSLDIKYRFIHVIKTVKTACADNEGDLCSLTKGHIQSEDYS